MGKQRTFAGFITSKIPFGTGNRNELLAQRDRVLTARYYYHFHLRRLREDDTFTHISKNEIFLAPDTIYLIITKQNEYLNELISHKCSAARLQLEYPSFRFIG